MLRDSRGQFASAEPAEPLLTYPYLSSLSVTPGPDVYSHRGDYGGSPLGYAVGLHIHQDGDTWFETEPERPVHFVVNNSKIAVVYPDYLQVNYSQDEENMYLDSVQKNWMRRLRNDHKTAGLEIRNRH